MTDCILSNLENQAKMYSSNHSTANSEMNASMRCWFYYSEDAREKMENWCADRDIQRPHRSLRQHLLNTREKQRILATNREKSSH